MKRRYLALLALAITFVTGSPASAEDFVPLIAFDQQLFPSFIISTASMKSAPPEEGQEVDPSAPVVIGDRDGLLGIKFVSPKKDTQIKVTITCDDVMEESQFSGKLSEKGKEYHIYPKIKYRFTKLAEVTQATPVSMTFRLQIGNDVDEQTATVMLRPIHDCPFLVQEGELVLNTSFTFAAYVNEQHPFLDKLLREALDIGIVESFSGYQQDEAEVIRQVYSIWDALVTRDVRYSSITATSVKAQTVASQHVRLIEESLNNSQANCVDGSVLLASALRKIGIEPFLVLVPGHCYVGFYVDEKKENMLAIETTMLGDAYDEDEEYDAMDLLEESVDEEDRYDESWPSFSSAIVAGTTSLEEHSEKLASDSEPEYMLIDIDKARDRGILPIAFRGKDKFVSNGLDTSESDAAEDEEAEMSEEESEE
jgi:hypothetical protein